MAYCSHAWSRILRIRIFQIIGIDAGDIGVPLLLLLACGSRGKCCISCKIHRLLFWGLHSKPVGHFSLVVEMSKDSRFHFLFEALCCSSQDLFFFFLKKNLQGPPIVKSRRSLTLSSLQLNSHGQCSVRPELRALWLNYGASIERELQLHSWIWGF